MWPEARRGAAKLSPYIRHGLLSLPEVWEAVEGGPARDVSKYQDELLWQEFSRHLYARLGRQLAEPLQQQPPSDGTTTDVWSRDMACMDLCISELEGDGWLVNQTRMWLASHWTVRRHAHWRDGEDYFFRHLLDGSRAANRLGWQWTIGSGSSKPYGFSRSQVEKRAPSLCKKCRRLAASCPVEHWPKAANQPKTPEPSPLRSDPDLETTMGPRKPRLERDPDVVWITAESLGDADPALAAHPELPVVFVFDEPLLKHLRLSRKRLIFLVETLAELAVKRPLHLHRGRPEEVLEGSRVAVTFTPVPGWRKLAKRIGPAATHPWPWLAKPHASSLRSFSAWRKKL